MSDCVTDRIKPIANRLRELFLRAIFFDVQKRLSLLRLALIAVSVLPVCALDNGLARTPPMGWNSWNKFGCNVSEKLIRETADSMVNTGLKDVGYHYVVIDDCWQVSRDAHGNIVPDAQRFPSGMKALADYVHSKGLKFGVYSDAGTGTCQNRPGSRGYEFQDARQYAAWGVDYLKYDWCNHSTQNSEASYSIMRDALRKAGRPIVFSLCEWGSTQPWLWAKDVGNLWRATGDIVNKWSGSEKWGGLGVIQIVDLMNDIAPYTGPGHWNDPDMLEVGNGVLSDTEARAHFSMWCMFAAPLIAGNDVRDMNPAIRTILENKELIAIDQDSLGLSARRVHREGDVEVWSKQLSDGGRALALLNRGEAPAKTTVSWVDIGYPADISLSGRDLWSGKNLGTLKRTYSGDVPSHGAVVLRLSMAAQ